MTQAPRECGLSNEFREDLARLTADLAAARLGLEEVVSGLREADFARRRRGGWTVERVLHHVIASERAYARLLGRLRGDTPPFFADIRPLDSGSTALAELAASRLALEEALEGVGEDEFYRLQALGQEEYSVLSVLENVANHDREHTGQIAAILASG